MHCQYGLLKRGYHFYSGSASKHMHRVGVAAAVPDHKRLTNLVTRTLLHHISSRRKQPAHLTHSAAAEGVQDSTATAWCFAALTDHMPANKLGILLRGVAAQQRLVLTTWKEPHKRRSVTQRQPTDCQHVLAGQRPETACTLAATTWSWVPHHPAGHSQSRKGAWVGGDRVVGVD
jgi:hypothetical protein